MHPDLKEIYDNGFLPQEGKRKSIFRKYFHIGRVLLLILWIRGIYKRTSGMKDGFCLKMIDL